MRRTSIPHDYHKGSGSWSNRAFQDRALALMAPKGPRVQVLNKAILFRDLVLLPATPNVTTCRSLVREALARSISRESLSLHLRQRTMVRAPHRMPESESLERRKAPAPKDPYDRHRSLHTEIYVHLLLLQESLFGRANVPKDGRKGELAEQLVGNVSHRIHDNSSSRAAHQRTCKRITRSLAQPVSQMKPPMVPTEKIVL
jgi:hypothetical protein